MNLASVPVGEPEEFNVFIEISSGSVNQYEYDEALQALKLDYVFRDGFHFPFNYGFVPHTKAADNDPLDAVVLSSSPIQPSAIVAVKPLGILRLKDRGEQDNKLITVPSTDPLSGKWKAIDDLSEKERDEIVAFFKEVGVQKNKTMDIEGFEGRDEAITEVRIHTL